MNEEFYIHSCPAPQHESLLKAVPASRTSTLQPYALSALRMVAGFTFALYGAQLVFGMFGGLLVGLGLLTRLAAFVLSGEMAFAFFLAHFPQGWNPILNGGETAVLFCS